MLSRGADEALSPKKRKSSAQTELVEQKTPAGTPLENTGQSADDSAQTGALTYHVQHCQFVVGKPTISEMRVADHVKIINDFCDVLALSLQKALGQDTTACDIECPKHAGCS